MHILRGSFLLLAFFGPAIFWGYHGWSLLWPAMQAICLNVYMVFFGSYRQGLDNEAGIGRSLVVGTLFAAIPCFCLYFFGHWLA